MGEITGVTLMGTDVDRILVGLRSIHEVWASLLDMGVAIYLLERQLGLACLVPGLLTLSFSLATFGLSSSARVSQKAWIEKVERRLAFASSILRDMRAVKLLGLDLKISRILDGLQRTEVETSSRFRKNLILQIFFCRSLTAGHAPKSQRLTTCD
jgi:ATP-binding cassette, subfamily C (CFTR/MRP), member 1